VMESDLIRAAIEVANRAYCPYSNYQVGCAVLTSDGKTVVGCNVENASYGLAICAERSALVSAVSLGHQNFKQIAVVTRNGGAPCGACRQFMHEFAPEMLVLLCDTTGKVHERLLCKELLPLAFHRSKL